MKTAEPNRTRQLVNYLTPLIVDLRNHNGGQVDRESAGDETLPEPDVDRAVFVELEHLLSADPDLRRLLVDPAAPDRQRVAERLGRLLTGRDQHSLEVLWALVAAGSPAVDAGTQAEAATGLWRRLWRDFPAAIWRFITSGWMKRQVAGIWMNALIAIALVLTWWLAWPPTSGEPETGLVVLTIFAVWSLSFLPGWLYVRFLGQRAGALWDEYVLCLHRLGYDRPCYLPRPLVTSEFYAEWFTQGGALFAHRQNIYRQKFDAYYGKSVSEGSHRKGAPVKVETLFPVFLTTATLAVCWIAVLDDPSFVSGPQTVWDVLKFGFLGAYLFILQMLIRRFFQSDLRPSAYASAMLRIITVLILAAALHQLTSIDNLQTEATVAFVVGFFPLIGMQALHRAAATILRVAVPSLNPPYPLNQIDGLSVWYEARLLEEGIEDMQSLATANFVDVMLHTRVPIGRLVDWVDQAQLYLHLDRMERGVTERFLRKGSDGAEPGATSKGSLSRKSRAGTRTRTTLRQFGVRNATDLLKAFPPSQMDLDGGRANSLWSEYLEALPAEGLNLSQLRTIVRVLSREPSLAPVWNWQRRGATIARGFDPS
jgi:hypothetical protein